MLVRFGWSLLYIIVFRGWGEFGEGGDGFFSEELGGFLGRGGILVGR